MESDERSVKVARVMLLCEGNEIGAIEQDVASDEEAKVFQKRFNCSRFAPHWPDEKTFYPVSTKLDVRLRERGS
jgi:hypothetical protein